MNERIIESNKLYSDYHRYYQAYCMSHDYSNPLRLEEWIKAGKPKD